MRGWKYERDDQFADVYMRRLLIAYGSMVGLVGLVVLTMMQFMP